MNAQQFRTFLTQVANEHWELTQVVHEVGARTQNKLPTMGKLAHQALEEFTVARIRSFLESENAGAVTGGNAPD